MLLLLELEELYILGADLVLALKFSFIGTVLELEGGGRLVNVLLRDGVLMLLVVLPSRLLPELPRFSRTVVEGLRMHDFELLLQTGLVDLFLPQFVLEGGDVGEGREGAGIHVLLAGLSEVVVTLLPESLLSLRLLQLLPSLLEIVNEEATLIDEDVDDLAELLGVCLAEVREELLTILGVHVYYYFI